MPRVDRSQRRGATVTETLFTAEKQLINKSVNNAAGEGLADHVCLIFIIIHQNVHSETVFSLR